MLMLRQTKLDDCAQAYVDLARNSSITGQAWHVGECSFRCLDGVDFG